LSVALATSYVAIGGNPCFSKSRSNASVINFCLVSGLLIGGAVGYTVGRRVVDVV
jgi:hypothetical protein